MILPSSPTPDQTRPVNDNGPVPAPAPSPAWAQGWAVRDLVGAVRFFSRIPIAGMPHETPNLDRIARLLPIASLGLGAGPALLLIVATFAHLPPLFATALSVGAMAILGGAMPEDALADAADGLFGGSTRERRLEILKDSRHGTYGVVALGLMLIMKTGALAAMAESNTLAAAGAWLVAGIIARSGALWLAVALPAARSTGASASAGRVSRGAFAIGLVLALILALGIGLPSAGPAAILVGLALSVAIALGWTRLCNRLVGGQTGDLIGALQALIEVTMLGCLSVAFF